MTKVYNTNILSEIYNIKKDLLSIRIKKSSGDNVSLNTFRSKKKEVARLFTKLNLKK
tara:strand:+ start:4499 stop:4669 length:171 start_codon:yes stop_codon:yes gene_type:complete